MVIPKLNMALKNQSYYLLQSHCLIRGAFFVIKNAFGEGGSNFHNACFFFFILNLQCCVSWLGEYRYIGGFRFRYCIMRRGCFKFIFIFIWFVSINVIMSSKVNFLLAVDHKLVGTTDTQKDYYKSYKYEMSPSHQCQMYWKTLNWMKQTAVWLITSLVNYTPH